MFSHPASGSRAGDKRRPGGEKEQAHWIQEYRSSFPFAQSAVLTTLYSWLTQLLAVSVLVLVCVSALSFRPLHCLLLIFDPTRFCYWWRPCSCCFLNIPTFFY